MDTNKLVSMAEYLVYLKVDWHALVHSFFGSVFEFYRHRKDFAHWMISNHRKYGKNGLWYLSAPGKTEIHVTEPKLIAYVFDQGDPPLDNINPTNRSSMDLLFHENNITLLKGDAWRARRRLTMNMFSPRLMKECVLPATEAVALELHKQIDKFADSGEFLDLQELCVRAMMESTLMLLVGKKPSSLDKEQRLSVLIQELFYVVNSRQGDPLWKLKRLACMVEVSSIFVPSLFYYILIDMSHIEYKYILK
eukprot:125890_1